MHDTRLAAAEIAALDPYKFMATIGKQVIHPRGRKSTRALLRRAGIDNTHRVLDVGCGVGTTAVEIAQRQGANIPKMRWLMPRYTLLEGTKRQ